MKEISDFLLANWYYVAAVLAVLYLLLQSDESPQESQNILSPQDLTLRMNKGDVTVFDLRSRQEYQSAHIHSVRHFDKGTSMSELAKFFKHNRDMVFVCKDGKVSARIAATVGSRSKMNVYVLSGGMDAWQKGLFPITMDAEQI